MKNKRTLSQAGFKHLKFEEGFRSKPYRDQAGVATIGFGNTYYPDGTRVKMTDAPLSELEALELMQTVVAEFEDAVNKYVKINLNQNQFDALVSFTYNVGKEAFRTSTLLKVINVDPCNFKEIEHQFSRWKNSGGKVDPVLVARRKREFKIYSS